MVLPDHTLNIATYVSCVRSRTHGGVGRCIVFTRITWGRHIRQVLILILTHMYKSLNTIHDIMDEIIKLLLTLHPHGYVGKHFKDIPPFGVTYSLDSVQN